MLQRNLSFDMRPDMLIRIELRQARRKIEEFEHTVLGLE